MLDYTLHCNYLISTAKLVSTQISHLTRFNYYIFRLKFNKTRWQTNGNMINNGKAILLRNGERWFAKDDS